MNAKMPQLKSCFEAAGFTEVKTVLSSGNVVCETPLKSPAEIEGLGLGGHVLTLGLGVRS